MTIDFTLSDAQQELQRNAQGFAETVLRPIVERIDRAADGWEAFLAGREAYREMARAGFTTACIPTEYGGGGFSMVDFAIAAEELSRVDISVPTTLLASGLGLQHRVELAALPVPAGAVGRVVLLPGDHPPRSESTPSRTTSARSDTRSRVGPWFNARDKRDIVALNPLDTVHFGITPPIENHSEVVNSTDNRHGISGYLSDPVVAARIHQALRA